MSNAFEKFGMEDWEPCGWEGCPKAPTVLFPNQRYVFCVEHAGKFLNGNTILGRLRKRFKFLRYRGSSVQSPKLIEFLNNPAYVSSHNRAQED